jgi:hypothetical protein
MTAHKTTAVTNLVPVVTMLTKRDRGRRGSRCRLRAPAHLDGRHARKSTTHVALARLRFGRVERVGNELVLRKLRQPVSGTDAAGTGCACGGFALHAPNNVNRLRLLAIEAWSVTAEMTDPGCRRAMERLGARYDWLADHVARRAAPSSQVGALPGTSQLPQS